MIDQYNTTTIRKTNIESKAVLQSVSAAQLYQDTLSVQLNFKNSELRCKCPKCNHLKNFSINRDGNRYKCWSCGASGAGSVSLCMLVRGCSFIQAIEWLVSQYSIDASLSEKKYPHSRNHHQALGKQEIRNHSISARGPLPTNPDQAKHTEAASIARQILLRAISAHHGYMKAKGLNIQVLVNPKWFQANTSYQEKPIKIPPVVAVFPIHDINGRLWSIQTVPKQPDSEGKFRKYKLSGGRTKDCFYRITGKPDAPLVITEGIATGYTIHEATDYSTLCSLSATNMPNVIRAAYSKFPGRQIIAAIDGDNAGFEVATTVREQFSQCQVIAPDIRGDFNDVMVQSGIITVVAAFGVVEL